MDELLPYYERELGIFREQTRAFAARYPKTAGNLLIIGDNCEDPHIERLIQSFAMLTARVHKRLDDDYPQFTEALLETLFPHYLRPFPACSIARLDMARFNGDSGLRTIPRGTVMRSQPVQKVVCEFRSAYTVSLDPLGIAAARFEPIISAPAAIGLAADAGALISIAIDSQTETGFAAAPAALRVFVDGEPSFRAALLDTLFLRTAGAYAELDDDGRWLPLDRVPLQPVGYADDEALIPAEARSHPAFRLLTEYFAFPEKFNFIDIGLASVVAQLPRPCRRVTLHLAIKNVRGDSDLARLLGTLSAHQLLLGCTPVVNLFTRPGVPIRLTQTSADYPLLADAAHADGYDIHSVEAVHVCRQHHGGQSVAAVLPLYGRGQDRPEQAAGASDGYWLLRRDAALAAASPGHEFRLALVDADADAAPAGNRDRATLSTSLLCSNRDLPAALRYGRPEGDLQSSAVPDGLPIQLLRKPTAPQRFAAGNGAHWRLIAHLSLNYANLTDAGLADLRKMLTLYDLPRSAISQRQIGGIVGLCHGATRAWINTLPCPTLMPGVAIRLTIDERAFVGSGLFAFAQVMDRYFALNRQLNSYTRLEIVSQHTGEELILCPPRTAEPTRA